MCQTKNRLYAHFFGSCKTCGELVVKAGVVWSGRLASPLRPDHLRNLASSRTACRLSNSATSYAVGVLSTTGRIRTRVGKCPMRPCISASNATAAAAYTGGLRARGRVCHSSELRFVASAIFATCSAREYSLSICTGTVRISASVPSCEASCSRCVAVNGCEKFRTRIISETFLILFPTYHHL